MLTYTSPLLHVCLVVRACLSQVLISRRQRHELIFGANKKVQELIFPRVVVDKEEMQAMPAVIEAELRAEALKAIDDVFKKFGLCTGLVNDNGELYARPWHSPTAHELQYVRVVDIHLKHSMGCPTPGAPGVGLWAYDLDKALFAFECIFNIEDLDIDRCIFPSPPLPPLLTQFLLCLVPPQVHLLGPAGVQGWAWSRRARAGNHGVSRGPC